MRSLRTCEQSGVSRGPASQPRQKRENPPELVDPDLVLQAVEHTQVQGCRSSAPPDLLLDLPLSDDLSVGFHQVIGDVPPRQVLQRVCGAQLHLNNNSDVRQIQPSCSGPARPGPARPSSSLTSGGGGPPAPAGQSGSIFLLPSQLHKQAGDGFSMVQFLELSSCWTLSGTSGRFQSSSPIVQGTSLRSSRRATVRGP